MKKTLSIITCIMFLLFEGCAFVSISLKEPVLPLREKEVDGDGKYKFLIVDISGTITSEKRRSLIGADKEPDSLVARIKEELKKAAEDKKIKAVILGGIVNGQYIGRRLDNAQHCLIAFRIGTDATNFFFR